MSVEVMRSSQEEWLSHDRRYLWNKNTIWVPNEFQGLGTESQPKECKNKFIQDIKFIFELRQPSIFG